MIKVKFVLVEEKDYKEVRTVLEERTFENAINWYDIDVEDFIYNKVLDLDVKYDFINYENAPLIEILYINSNENVIKRDDCIDYMFGL